MIAWCVALLSFVVVAATLRPRLGIQPAQETVNQDPTPNLFYLKNEGILPLEDIQPGVGLCHLSFYFGQGAHMVGDCPTHGPIRSVLAFLPWRRARLDIGQRYTISFQDMLRMVGPIQSADISIGANYRVWFLPFTFHDEVRYATKQEADGQLYWFEK